MRKARFQAVEEGIAHTCGDTRYGAFDDAAHAVAFFSRFQHLIAHGFPRLLAYGAVLAHLVYLGSDGIKAHVLDACYACDMRSHFYALFAQNLLADCAREHERSGEPAGRMTAAAVVVEAALFHKISPIAVTGAHKIAHALVVGRVRVLIADDCGKRSARSRAVEKAADYLVLVAFPACGGDFLLALGAAARHHLVH